MFGFVLFGFYFVGLACYFWPEIGYDFGKGQIRSISKIICLCPGISGFCLGIGNTIMFEMVYHTQPIAALFLCASGQGVLSFFSNSYSISHHFFLFCYMASLVYIVVQFCIETQSLWVHAMPFYAFTFLFGATFLINVSLKIKYKSIQAIFELYWMLSFVYFFSLIDKNLTT
jgi:hypothetical protein